MADLTGSDYRANDIRQLELTEDEQMYCRGLLNSIERDALKGYTHTVTAHMKSLEQRVHWLRSDKGQQWMKEQKL